jgi:hypothetical protein
MNRTFTPDEVAALAVVAAVIIVLYHVHKNQDYDSPYRAFQTSEVSNHETWVVAIIAFAAGLHLSQYAYFTDQTSH